MNTPTPTHPSIPPPSEQDIARWIVESYRHWTGRWLLPEEICNQGDAEVAAALNDLPAVVVSHDSRPDPVFQYGNRTALDLFELSRDAFLQLPSRFSAEPGERDAREAVLQEVSEHGFSDHYSGVRVSSTGKRFRIEQATLWNLLDAHGGFRGQAATFSEWTLL